MAVARPNTRPVRVHDTDHVSLRALSLLEGRVPAEIIHEALREYVARRGAELSDRFSAAQRAFASGNIDAVEALLREGSDARVATMKQELDALR
jgi:hypothetical protein